MVGVFLRKIPYGSILDYLKDVIYKLILLKVTIFGRTQHFREYVNGSEVAPRVRHVFSAIVVFEQHTHVVICL